MRRVFALLLSLGLMTAGSLPAQTNHLDLKGKQIKLAILGDAGIEDFEQVLEFARTAEIKA